jgi:hypothetical protein
MCRDQAERAADSRPERRVRSGGRSRWNNGHHC